MSQSCGAVRDTLVEECRDAPSTDDSSCDRYEAQSVFPHWSVHRSLCLPPFYGAVHGDSTIIGIDVRPFQTANLSDTQASGQTDIDAEVAECEVLFDEIEDLSLHGSYMPVTWFYSSTNLVDNFFHNLWQISNVLTRFQRLLALSQAMFVHRPLAADSLPPPKE